MGEYDYFIHPVTDGVPQMDPLLLVEVLDGLKEIGDFHCDLLVAPEAMGIPLAVPLSLELGIPYTIVRKRKYGLPGEVEISQQTGYSRKQMYINGVRPGERVVVLDDVLSTGGTLRAVIQGLRVIGADIVDVLVVVEKGGNKTALESELGVRIKTLAKVKVEGGKVVLLS